MSFQFQREILSPANVTVKTLVRLHTRRNRRSTRQMLIDGVRPCLVALRSGFTVETIYACPELFRIDDPELAELMAEVDQSDVSVVRISRPVADKIACRENSDGIIAVSQNLDRPLENLAIGENPLLLLMEGIEKPGNLGAMLRTADGAGIDAVIVCDPVTDLGNPNVIRASMGTVFSMKIGVSDAVAVRSWLADRDIRIVAASPDATQPYWDADMSQGCAIAVGAEHAGLSAAWRSEGGGVTPVAIPMRGQADSLNVSTAAALMIYEAIRQRR